MLYLLSLKETTRRLRDGEWSPKADLFCLIFFLLLQWLSARGGWTALSVSYKLIDLYAIGMCWRANGAGRGIHFLSRLLALYRCNMLRLWAVSLSSVVLMLLAGFISCVFSGNLHEALNGECATLISNKILDILDVRPSFSFISDPRLLSVGYFVYMSVFGFFWWTIDSALVKLSVRKPFPALPAGSEPLSDLSD